MTKLDKRVPRFPSWTPAVLLAAYAVIWNLIASPYRLFPSDDDAFLPTSLRRAELHLRQPVFTLWVDFWNLVAPRLSADSTAPLLWQGVAANGVSSLLCGVIAACLARSPFWGYVGATMFALSCWPATYLFMASYTSFGGLISLVLLALLLLAYFRWTEAQDSRVAGIWRSPSLFIVAAGGVGGLLVFTSPAAPLMLAVTVVGVAYLFWGPWRNCVGWLGLFAAPVFICIVAILVFNPEVFNAILQHARENIQSAHYAEARARFGYIPTPPSETIFFILRYYSPSMLVLFISVLLVWIATRLLRVANGVEARAIDAVFIMAVGHALLIDIAPTTKLARSHFVAYPLLIIAVAAAAGVLTRSTRNRRWASAMAGAMLILFLTAASENLNLIVQLRSAKQSAFDAIQRLGPEPVYFVGNEAERTVLNFVLQHAGPAQGATKSLFPMQTEQFATVMNQARQSRLRVRKISVIIGPNGVGSGRSIRQQCTLPDTPEVRTRAPEDMQAIRLPYYTYFPAFLFEEEICEALYFRGEAPDFRRQDLGLTLWITRP